MSIYCPECKESVWDVAKDNKLNKCWNCGLAFCSDSAVCDEKYTAYFDRFQIEMTKEWALQCSHAGDCLADIVEAIECPAIVAQLAQIEDGDLFDELSEYGAWDDVELSDRQKNEQRIIWIAAGNIREDYNL